MNVSLLLFLEEVDCELRYMVIDQLCDSGDCMYLVCADLR